LGTKFYEEKIFEVCMISPLYQAITTFSGGGIPSGAGDTNYFEPLLNYIIMELNKLMRVYQALEEEK
jgi:hypothetical protein